MNFVFVALTFKNEFGSFMIMKRRILNECVRRARQVTHPEFGRAGFLHFSFVIQNKQILGLGFNRFGGAQPGFGYRNTRHSENDAYQKCKGILRSRPWSMVNIRLNKKRELMISRPCVCCVCFLEAVRCDCVFYSSNVGFLKLKLRL